MMTRWRSIGRRALLAAMALVTAGTLVTAVPTPSAAATCDDPVKGNWSDNCLVDGSNNYSTNLTLAAQYVLHCSGFKPGPRDGIWSPQTKGAVLRFQQAKWPNDPSRWTQAVDGNTWTALRGNVSLTRTTGNKRYFRAGVKCTGERFVKNTQTGLWKVREEPSPVNRGYLPMQTDCGRGETLRPASAKSIRLEAAALAKREKARWGGRTETDPAMAHVLKAYWKCGHGVVYGPDVAWSAAFVSHVMKWADAGSAFAYSSNHVTYVAAAKRNRVKNVVENPFWAFRPSERAPAVGDLVCKERAGSGVTYDNVDDGRFRASHCDIVVERRAHELVIIGGNVGNTVQSEPAMALRENTVPIDANGRVTQSNVYAVVIIRGRS